VALVLSVLIWSAGAPPASGDSAPSATIGDVVCVDFDGTVAVTLTAGDDATGFIVFTDGSADDDDQVTVPGGTSSTLTLTGLSDDDHAIEVDLTDGDGDGVPIWDELASATVTPDCDQVPVGPYTNPKGTIGSACYGDSVDVAASNKPIGGNVADLQAAGFTVTFAAFVDQPTDGPTDDPTDGPTDDPTDGTGDPGGDEDPPTLDPITLDSFTLDATTRTYARTFGFTDINAAGILTLSVDGTVIAKQYYEYCPTAGTAGTVAPPSHAALPNTGA
jgi:hypothetical protein